MASTPVQPLRPNVPFVDGAGNLTHEGYEFLKNAQVLINQLRAAAIANGWTL